MNDKTLVDRLRSGSAITTQPLMNEAADTIEAQATRIEALEAACQMYLDAFGAGTGTVYVEPEIRKALGDTDNG